MPLRQRDETDQFKQFGIPGGPFENVLLTPSGYTKLGVTAAAIAGLSDAHFKGGMKAHGAEFNDPAPATWDAGFNSTPIDAMLLLADDDEGFLLREARQLINEAADFADVVQIERGNALRTAEGEGIEHFGYVDGVTPLELRDIYGASPTIAIDRQKSNASDFTISEARMRGTCGGAAGRGSMHTASR